MVYSRGNSRLQESRRAYLVLKNFEYKIEQTIKIAKDIASDVKQYWQKAFKIKNCTKNKTADTKSPEIAAKNNPWANTFLLSKSTASAKNIISK